MFWPILWVVSATLFLTCSGCSCSKTPETELPIRFDTSLPTPPPKKEPEKKEPPPPVGPEAPKADPQPEPSSPGKSSSAASGNSESQSGDPSQGKPSANPPTKTGNQGAGSGASADGSGTPKPTSEAIAARVKSAKSHRVAASNAAKRSKYGEAFAEALLGWEAIHSLEEFDNEAKELTHQLLDDMKIYGERSGTELRGPPPRGKTLIVR